MNEKRITQLVLLLAIGLALLASVSILSSPKRSVEMSIGDARGGLGFSIQKPTETLQVEIDQLQEIETINSGQYSPYRLGSSSAPF